MAEAKSQWQGSAAMTARMNCSIRHPSADGNAHQSLHTLLAPCLAFSHRPAHLRRSQNLRDYSVPVLLEAANFGQLPGPELLGHGFHGSQHLRNGTLAS